ncbi:MAG: hypothetical protein MUE59_08995 [Thiobacillaceae bacterium]|nr:hypothetical protein [Thiobacillaceae bacterium]
MTSGLTGAIVPGTRSCGCARTLKGISVISRHGRKTDFSVYMEWSRSGKDFFSEKNTPLLEIL